MHEVVERRTADAEHIRRLGDVAADSRKYAHNRAPLCFLSHLAQVQQFQFGIVRLQAEVGRGNAQAVGMITARLMQFSSSRTFPGQA